MDKSLALNETFVDSYQVSCVLVIELREFNHKKKKNNNNDIDKMQKLFNLDNKS